jgi:hypothetical protein
MTRLTSVMESVQRLTSSANFVYTALCRFRDLRLLEMRDFDISSQRTATPPELIIGTLSDSPVSALLGGIRAFANMAKAGMDRIGAVATVKDLSVKWFDLSERGSFGRGAIAFSLDFAFP